MIFIKWFLFGVVARVGLEAVSNEHFDMRLSFFVAFIVLFGWWYEVFYGRKKV